MTDLTERLAALGVTLPEVEALADPRTARDIERLRANYNGVEQLQAALAAVVGLLEDARHHNWVESQITRKATRRAEKAEAENARLREAWRNDHNALTDRGSELLAENKLLVDHAAEHERLQKQAEAETARLMRLLDKPFLEKLTELEAENARLRVCGTCKHCNTQDQPECQVVMKERMQVLIDDKCEWTPSRWTPCWEET